MLKNSQNATTKTFQLFILLHFEASTVEKLEEHFDSEPCTGRKLLELKNVELFFFVIIINQPYPTNHNVTLLSLARSFYTTTTDFIISLQDLLLPVQIS